VFAAIEHEREHSIRKYGSDPTTASFEANVLWVERKMRKVLDSYYSTEAEARVDLLGLVNLAVAALQKEPHPETMREA
jgi:hypothetical protein